MINVLSKSSKQKENTYSELKSFADKLFERKELGFLHVAERLDYKEQILHHKNRIKKVSKKQVILGIGGSALGAKSIIQACKPLQTNLEFWDTVDPDYISSRFNSLRMDLSEIHWIAISKSGSTLETLSLVNYVAHQLKTRGINFFENLTVITETKKSPLFDLATSQKCPVLEHPKDIGGRFSAFSVVGLLPAALCEINIDDIFQGVSLAKKNSLCLDIACEMICTWKENKWVSVLWAYDEKLESFVAWLRQLWAESLAKKVELSGAPADRVSSPLFCLGTRAQHSELQQFVEGTKDKSFFFFYNNSTKSSEQNFENLFPELNYLDGQSLFSTNYASCQSCISSIKEIEDSVVEFQFEAIDERSIAYLMHSFLLAIGIIGEYLNINAYDQPGVERGKSIARSYLKDHILFTKKI